MAAVRHFGFVGQRVLGGLSLCKFSWNHFSSFNNMKAWIFCVWLENAYSHPLLGYFWVTRSSAVAEGLCDVLVNIEKNLQSMNDLDIHPRSSQLLLSNGQMAYHFLFVDCCFKVFIYDRFQHKLPLLKWTLLPVTLRTPSFLTTKLKLQAMCAFWFMCWHTVVKSRFIYEL